MTQDSKIYFYVTHRIKEDGELEKDIEQNWDLGFARKHAQELANNNNLPYVLTRWYQIGEDIEEPDDSFEDEVFNPEPAQAKHTPAHSLVKYFVAEAKKWPFDIKITDSFGDEVCTFARAVVSSSWDTLEDVHTAYRWKDGTCNLSRDEVLKKIKEQMDYIHLFAAAPDLLKACNLCLKTIQAMRELGERVDSLQTVEWKMKKVVTKATGE